MSGRKGRSGRPINIENVTLFQIINRAMSLTWRFMNDESQPLDKRAEVASRFILKRMADKVEVEVTQQLSAADRAAMFAALRNLAASIPIEAEVVSVSGSTAPIPSESVMYQAAAPDNAAAQPISTEAAASSEALTPPEPEAVPPPVNRANTQPI